jgi:hypothetical protein
LTFVTAEYASWGNIGTVCTVFKYVLLQKRYPKLLIKLGTDFEVGQKRKTVPYRFTFGTNNLEIPKYTKLNLHHPPVLWKLKAYLENIQEQMLDHATLLCFQINWKLMVHSPSPMTSFTDVNKPCNDWPFLTIMLLPNNWSLPEKFVFDYLLSTSSSTSCFIALK